MTEDTPEDKAGGERIAKVMARAGVASRRDAERMIVDGRVAVNGKVVTSPALDVLPADKVTLDGKPIDAPQPARLWLYYKPLGLVTSAKDEKGRQTVFDTLPEGMPRVMSVGRLDLNSEGLLLLTNDGELKRRLELPSTGWLRKYRVRVNGRPNEMTFDPLRRGVTIDGEEFLPMEITLDKQQGANAWLTVGIREGKNREIRRAMTQVGLIVNRLIRVSYGPFRLNKMKPGDVAEVKQKILKEQLGESRGAGEDRPRRKPPATTGVRPSTRPDRKPRPPRAEDHVHPRPPRAKAARPDWETRPPRAGGDDRKSRAPRAEGAGNDRKPRTARPEGDDRKPRPPRAEGGFDRKPRKPGPDDAARKPRAPRSEDAGYDRKPRAARPEGDDRRPRGPRAEGGFDRKPRKPVSDDAGRKPAPRPGGGFDRKPRAPRAEGGDSRPPRGGRPETSGDRPPRPGGPKPRGGGPRRPGKK